MSGWCRQMIFPISRDCIEELLELLEDILRKVVGRSNPDARDNCLLDPSLVLFSEEPHVDEVVKRFAGCDIAVEHKRR
jgi:hypothetical protein